MNVLAHVANHAASAPVATAHRWAGGSLTWGDLWARSGALAGSLDAALADEHSPVVILAHKQSLALVCMLACVRSGRPYVPVDDSIAPARLAAIADAAGASLLLTASDVPDVELPCPVWDAHRIEEAATSDTPAPSPERATTGDQTWYVIFTSGSTGEPKGVQISADNLATFVSWLTSLAPEGPQVWLNQAPWSFDLSVMDTWPALATGSTLVSLDRDQIGNPAKLADALLSSGGTVWVSTPSFANLCLALPDFDASMVPVQQFLFCGETLPPATACALLERFPDARVTNTYGPTEATVAVTEVAITPEVLAAHASLPVGRVKPGCAITIRDAQGDALPDGETGEIWIHGDSVSAGYLGRPDLTARSFAPAEVDGRQVPTYRTGDAGHLSDGLLFFAGRQDNQVKLHGYRIELGDIEANLNRLPQVGASVVLPRSEDGALTHLEAVVHLADPDLPRGLLTTVALRRALGELLPSYMVPKTFTYVEEFPMTPNGKVDRKALAGA